MSCNEMNLKAELENVVKTRAAALLEDSPKPIDCEQTPPSDTSLNDLIAEFELEAKTGVFISKLSEQDADENP